MPPPPLPHPHPQPTAVASLLLVETAPGSGWPHQIGDTSSLWLWGLEPEENRPSHGPMSRGRQGRRLLPEDPGVSAAYVGLGGSSGTGQVPQGFGLPSGQRCPETPSMWWPEALASLRRRAAT